MKANTPRFNREARTIRNMVGLYCRDRHGHTPDLCDDCAGLVSYALGKLERCPWGENKPVCARCTIHCYEKSLRARIGQVMRYAGPKMIRHHPVLAIFHLLQKYRLARAPLRPKRVEPA
jgi:hypothetical protein